MGRAGGSVGPVDCRFAQASGGVKVFGHPHTFLPRIYEDKKGKRKRGGPPEGEGLADLEAVGAEVILSSKPVEVVPGLYTTGQINRTTFEIISKPISGNKRLIVIEDEIIDDQILDDQSLWADVKGVGSWVITGCAHAGPINTLLQVQKLGSFNTIEGLVGGTHLVGRSDDYIKETINEMKKFGLNILSPCHCTGFKAASILWSAFPKEFVVNCCLREIEAGKAIEQRLI